MMETTTLQTPKTGRSRFSKALPAPPSFFERKSSLPSPPSLPSLPPQLPPLSLGLSGVSDTISSPIFQAPAPSRSQSRQVPSPAWTAPQTQTPRKVLPPIQAGPPRPPPKQVVGEAPSPSPMAATAKPLDSPLPPLPRKPSALPLMSIPRRPVAAPQPAALSPAPVSVSVPAQAPVSPITSSPSPVGSISSILSAYSNHSSESTPRSSTNSANDIGSAKGSYTTASPGEADKQSASTPGRNAQESPGSELRTPDKEDESLPPPPPLKDIRQETTRSAPARLVDQRPQDQGSQSPAATQAAPTTLANTLPQQDQLWRRRSLRSEKNLAVTELKLVSSHGSTAASTQLSSQGAPAPNVTPHLQDRPEPGTPGARTGAPPPRSTNAAFPGRNIRPAASRQQIAAPEGEDIMGQKVSNLAKDLAGRNHGNGSSPAAPRTTHDAPLPAPPAPAPAPTASPMKAISHMTVPHSVARLPTPEYEHSDVKSPIVERVVSPVSPASSPDIPSEPSPAIQRKPVKPVNDTESQLRQMVSSPSLAPKASNPALSARPTVGLPASPVAHRAAGQTQFPTRTSSRRRDERPSAVASRQDPAGPASIQVPKQREQQFKPFPDELRSVSEDGSIASDETVRPRGPGQATANNYSDTTLAEPLPEAVESEESELTDNPGAALFPRNWYKPSPVDDVMDARPLEPKHFRCLTNHRYMTANRQRYNPIACRTCGHRDRTSDCYICSACYLNICPSCTGALRRFRGNLEQLLGHIKEQNTAENTETSEATESAGSTESSENTKNKARPDSDTYVVPPTNPPLSFVIEVQ